ncbi:hypothetical protein GCM10008955_33420 [Deinococcus malanensis]|uniref:Uncharacterized protein n=2 Tax=Deinococcus malanensis TaxID=1706855 RepID=A0ABQ2EZU8_9DEIO|nr:hypothetical protein GCM10008955_33420 [Deinococcus malanensis]
MFQPGRPLPTDSQTTQERTLYHQARGSGAVATMTREGGTWQWRELHGNAPDGSGSGGWNDLQKWLNQQAERETRSTG